MIRRHYLFYGRVQGVGFRFTTYQKAKNLGLTGWVCNLSDGSVEACIQGEEKLIDYLIKENMEMGRDDYDRKGTADTFK